MTNQFSPSARRRPIRLVFALIAVTASIVIYFAASAMLGSHVLVQAAPQIDTAADPFGSYAFSFLDVPQLVPDLTFVDANNQPLTLANFRGRPVVLNIWATWCVPCRKEMPSLDRLQALLPTDKLTVLALSLDRQAIETVKAFYDELHLRSLSVYVDPKFDTAAQLGLPGVPGTLLIDAEGREVGRKLGPTEWDSPEVLSILTARLGIGMPQKGVSGK